MSHFHIRWSGSEAMDWGFSLRGASCRLRDAPGDTYVIEELGEGCTRCQAGNTERPR